jgi:FtsZ-interacting cell division protein ZipA
MAVVWIVIVIVVVAVVALVAVGARKRRTALLRDRFGPEYDRMVENSDDRRAAEAGLRDRERQRAQFDVEPLPEADRVRFAAEWRDLQERFVDQPAPATAAADALITRVMEARGYPMTDFDAQADLISVDHPDTVENYRFAHAVQQRSETEQASTEDLREALLRYRSLFDELLRPEGNGAAGRERVMAQPQAQDPEAGAALQTDGLDAEESSSLPGPAAADTDYHDQQIGR